MGGPRYLTALAKIYAQLGEPTPAIKLVKKLLAMPAGLDLSAPLLRLDPVWDPIRKAPAFQALLKKYGRKPAAATGVATENPPL
ncbi:MAG: hypothetical protein ACRESR_00655 [Gammaproteobacteria bacterium]